jgi:hypothetical protein
MEALRGSLGIAFFYARICTALSKAPHNGPRPLLLNRPAGMCPDCRKVDVKHQALRSAPEATFLRIEKDGCRPRGERDRRRDVTICDRQKIG